MATKSKTTPLDAARAKVNALDEQEREARVLRDEARARLADLQDRNYSGDQSVTGLDLTTARGEVERTEGLADSAARMLAEAQAEAAALLADVTAREVREGIVHFDIPTAVHKALEAATAAVQGLSEVLTQRDAASDAAGQALADAGVPVGRWVNGIRYFPVHSGLGGSGRVMRGQFNVEVQTDDGGVWLAGVLRERTTTQSLTRMVDDVLGNARAGVSIGPKSRGGIQF